MFTTRKLCVVTKLYKAIVHPHLEFGMILASPHYKMDIKALESVLRRATKLIPALYDKLYEECPVSLKTPHPSLYKEERRCNWHSQTTRKWPLNSSILIIPCKVNKRSHKRAASPLLPEIFLCTCCPLLEQPLQCHHPVPNYKCIQERSQSGLGQCRM